LIHFYKRKRYNRGGGKRFSESEKEEEEVGDKNAEHQGV